MSMFPVKRLVFIIALVLAAGAARAYEPVAPPYEPANPPYQVAEPYDPYAPPANSGCQIVHDRAWNYKPEWKNKNLSKAQCRREVRSTTAWIKAYLKKDPRNAITSLSVTSCLSYCEDLYPDLKE